VIISEIGQAYDTPDDVVFDDLLEAAFPGQPLGRSILGTVDTVSGFGRDDLHGYMGERYSAPGMVLAAAGGLDHQALVRLARERFTKLPDRRNNGAPKALFQGGEIRKERDLEQTHL